MSDGIEGIVRIADKEFPIQYRKALDRYDAVREPVVPQLGKRYACAQRIDDQVYSGERDLIDGVKVYFGCGTAALCIKSPTGAKAPYCCGMPMTQLEPETIPSSD